MNCKWCGDPLGSDLLEYCGDECRDSDAAERRECGDQPPHALRAVRDQQEAAQPEWSDRIYWAIVDRLRDGEFHADDLAPLAIPAERRNIVGAQLGSLVRAGFVVEVGRRKSQTVQGHSRKSGIYELTEKGRAKFLSVGAGLRRGPGNAGLAGQPRTSSDPGERESLTLVPDSVGAEAPKSHIRDAEAAA